METSDAPLSAGGSGGRPCVVLDVIELDTPRVDVDPTRLRSLTAFVLAAEGRSGTWPVTIVLTGDRRLRALHRDFLAVDENTDVMTFPFGEDDGSLGGEIVISVERAAEQGADHSLTARQEVEFLVVHGLLHLCGWDDSTGEERHRMLARQQELLADFEGTPSDFA